MNNEAFSFYTDILVEMLQANNAPKAADAMRRAAKAGAGNSEALAFLHGKLKPQIKLTPDLAFQEPFLTATYEAFRAHFPKGGHKTIDPARELADLYFETKRFAEEALWRRRVLDYYKESRVNNRLQSVASARIGLANALLDSGDLDAALSELALLRGREWEAAKSAEGEEEVDLLAKFGAKAFEAGRLDEAYAFHEEALKLYGERGEYFALEGALQEMALIREAQGRTEEAASLTAKAAAAARESELKERQVDIVFNRKMLKRWEELGADVEAEQCRQRLAELEAIERESP